MTDEEYYANELSEFYRWLKAQNISAKSRLLWYALMWLWYRRGFSESVKIRSIFLQFYCGISRKSVIQAREELIECKRIAYTSGTDNEPETYHIIPFTRK